jgi:D-erythronate 2-dehydrogenase
VRPGRPNKAASSFLSSIIREPLLGLSAELPVGEDFAAWIASPRRAVDWLLHAAALDTANMAKGVGNMAEGAGDSAGANFDRGINPPGISATVAQMLAALEAVKPGASALVRPAEDPEIAAIVGTWPAAFAPVRAQRLGFTPHESLLDLVRAFIADDLKTTRRERGLPD